MNASSAAQQPGPAARMAQIEQRFKAANKNGDGKLTLQEAKAGTPRVAKIPKIPDIPLRGRHSRLAFLEVTDKLLLLGVHRDHGFPRREPGLHALVDVNELRIAVRMALTFTVLRLACRLNFC